METLRISPTLNSLEISLDPDSGRLLFAGRSLPEDSASFFNPIMSWMEQYSVRPADHTECVFKLEYFNSAARKCIVEIFRILESMHNNGKNVSVSWMYDESDESMKETGEEYQELFKLRFKFSSY